MNVFKEMRLAAKLSQGELAKKMGYTSPQFCSNWERSLSVPPPASVKKLSKIYGRDDFEALYIEHSTKLHVEDLKLKIRGK